MQIREIGFENFDWNIRVQWTGALLANYQAGHKFIVVSNEDDFVRLEKHEWLNVMQFVVSMHCLGWYHRAIGVDPEVYARINCKYKRFAVIFIDQSPCPSTLVGFRFYSEYQADFFDIIIVENQYYPLWKQKFYILKHKKK